MDTDTINGDTVRYVIDDGDDQVDLGLKGQQRIRKMLSQHNPVNFIHEFQGQNGLHYPNTEAVLKFLDLLGISRSHVYASLNEKLLARLSDRFMKASEEQKQALLKASFRYIRVCGLNQVPIWLLSDRSSMPPECLHQLAHHAAVLDALPLNIVREVWAAHPNLFIAKLVEIFDRYVMDPIRLKTYQVFLQSQAPVCERRSPDPILQELSNWIGSSFPLYDIALRTIRDRFSATNHFGYCILRMELLMCLHDIGTATIVAQDPIHQLAWCLNAASRENVIEGRIMNEFAAQYVQLKDAGDIVPESGELAPETIAQLQDLSLILAHPFIFNVLLRSIESYLSRIVQAAQDDILPKDDEHVRVLTHALYVGCNVRKLLRSRRQFKLPKCPHTIFRKIYPLLGALILSCTDVDEISDGLVHALAYDKGQIGLCITMSFAIMYLSSYDYSRALVLLNVIGEIEISFLPTATLSPFSRFTATILSAMTLDSRHRSQLMSNATFRGQFFNSFLLKTARSCESIRTQCYEMLASISTLIPVADLANYLVSLQGGSSSPLTKHRIFEELIANIPELHSAVVFAQSQSLSSNPTQI